MPPMGPRGGVVTQRSAKPFTPVQFWSWPPSIQSSINPIKVLRPIFEAGPELRARSSRMRAKKGRAHARPPTHRRAAITRGLTAQQTAFQPSGNGISGQADPLSLAARGGALKVGKRATMESSPGTGATAVRTTSSNRSNSTSLIATSAFEGARSQNSLFPGLS